MRLSLLDQSPRYPEQTVGEALHASIARTELAESLGFERVWFAEHRHHGAFVGSSPLTLASAALQATQTIRVGSGGVLIAMNDPAQTAEAALALDALHPARVDLGVGKAGGSRSDYLRHLQSLSHLLGGNGPPLWVLGTSMTSTEVADKLDAGYAYGHFFNPRDATPALEARRAHRNNLIAVRIISGTDGDEARARALAFSAWRTRRDLGANEPLPRPGQVLDVPREFETRVLRNLEAVIAGDHDDVAAQVVALCAQTGTDEVMVTFPEPHPVDAANQLRGFAQAVTTLENRCALTQL